MSEIELTPLRPWETLEGRATQKRIARSQQTKARIISLERQLEEAKALLSDLPDHSDVDAAVFAANAFRGQLAEAKEKLKRCGQENCMGYRLDDAANWVREERLEEAKGKLEAADAFMEREFSNMGVCLVCRAPRVNHAEMSPSCWVMLLGRILRGTKEDE